MPAFVDHYTILGVAPTATTAEIRRAYRRRVAHEHADLHGSDPVAVERTRRLNLARDVLVDMIERARFDRDRRAHLAAATRDPLYDTVARTFGPEAPPSPPPTPATVIEPAPAWLRGAAVGLFAAVAGLGAGASLAAMIREARARGRQSEW